MSDHIDGPRQIGDPAADLTDLFAFTSPENPSHRAAKDKAMVSRWILAASAPMRSVVNAEAALSEVPAAMMT